MTSPALTPRSNRPLITLSLIQTGLFLVPLIVLGKAIGWPASLNFPPATVLPLILREAMSVQIGYWAYLLTSLAFVPLAIAMRSYLQHQGQKGLMIDTAAAIGIAAGFIKMLGIVRWLVAMPSLAAMHAATADPTARLAIEAVYAGINGYAGSVGELLGVQLLSGFWLVLTGVGLFSIKRRWLGLAGGVIGILFLATSFRTILPPLAILQSIAPPLALIWFPLFALSVYRKG